MPEISARQQVAEWFRQRIDGETEFKLPDLANEATAHFKRDRKFVALLISESIRAMVYDLGKKTITESRGVVVSIGAELADRETVRARTRASAASKKWQRWMEHVGDKHVSLMEMTREDLVRASAERRGRASRDIEVADLWDALAAKLEGGQAVKDRFTGAEIDALAEDLRSRMHRKNAS